jgi:sodium/bile acid cotransporter 7
VKTGASIAEEIKPDRNWIRTNCFVLALVLAVVLAFFFPEAGSQAGWLQPAILNNCGIVLILLLQGLSLPFERIKSGIGNWRLHLIIQTFTFGIFPLAGLLLNAAIPLIWTSEPPPIRDGFLYLCVLPSTVSTSVVLTAVARGNTAGALFNAAFSNILGVFLTPVLVHLLMSRTGQAAPFVPLLINITLLTMLPFFTGMLLRKVVVNWVEPHKVWVARISNTVIAFIVYSAFCDSVHERIWQRYGAAMIVAVIAFVALLFVGMSALICLAGNMFRLNWGDRVAAYFCSVKKTLAMGVPLAMLIFGNRSDLSIILLPIMIYHPLQLLLNGLLANRWAKRPSAGKRLAESKHPAC